MRHSRLFLYAAALAVPAATFAQGAAPSAKPPTHPEEVAYIDEGEKGNVYRRFPTGERLYTYDRDPAGKSACNTGCSSAWPPVFAPADAVPVGEWTIIRRADGKRQWALKGKPVYTRFHDAPDTAIGDGLQGEWHVVPYTARAVNPPVPAAATP